MTGLGEQSELIVAAIVKDLKSRAGLGDTWDEMFLQDQDSVEDDWRLIVRRILERP